MKTVSVAAGVLTLLVVGLVAVAARVAEEGGRAPDLRGVRFPAAKQALTDQDVAFETRVVQGGRPLSRYVVCYQSPDSAEPLEDDGMSLGLTVQCPLKLPTLDGKSVGVVSRRLEALAINWEALDARDIDFPDTVSDVAAAWIACYVDFEEITDSLTNGGFALYGDGEQITVPVYVAPVGRCNDTYED